MNLPDFLKRESLGTIRLTGHRIELYHVMRSYKEGYTAEMLHREYPTLPLGLIYRVLGFYVENKDDVDRYVMEVETELDRQEAAYEPSPAASRIRGILAERESLAKAALESSIALGGGQIRNIPPFLTRHEKGEIRLFGHRIDLFDLVPLYNEGHSAEMLLEFFPTLNLSLIHKTIAFYLENKNEVDIYLAKCEAESERHQATAPKAPTIEELQARRQAKVAVPTA